MLQACEFFEISKNTFFTERLRKTASLKTFSLRRLKVISTEYHVTLRDSKVDVAYRWDFLILIRNSKCWINNISESIAINKFSNENVINPFQPMFYFCTSWKHQKTGGCSDVFRGYRSGTLVENGLRACNWGKLLFLHSIFSKER